MTVLDSASTQSLRFLRSTSVLIRLSLLFSPTRLLTSGTVVVEIECLRVRVVDDEGLRSDDKEVVVVVVVVLTVGLAVVVVEVSTVSPFSCTDFFSEAVKFSLLQVSTLCWMNLTISARGKVFPHTPQVRVSPPTNSGSAVINKITLDGVYNLRSFKIEKYG